MREVRKSLASSSDLLRKDIVVASVLEQTGSLVLDGLFGKNEGLGICERSPVEEFGRLSQLVVESKISNEPLFVVAPVCPDYAHGEAYKLNSGVGHVGGKLLSRIASVAYLFERRGVDIRVQIHVADVEAGDENILRVSGETEESFLEKTSGTIGAIAARVNGLGLSQKIEVVSMREIFTKVGADYYGLQKQFEPLIVSSRLKKVRKTVETLMSLRGGEGSFERVDGSDRLQMIASELAGYGAYGEIVGGNALILSADAVSATPAYNFFRNGRSFNPVIQIRS